MALRGIKVIELAGLAPVPFCGMVLADFGATVIRVDRPGQSSQLDVLRNGKQAMTLDLKHPEGVQIFRKLCKESDVLIEPYRPGIMEKLTIGPDVLTKDNPRLVYARLTGFGQSGYYSKRAGHDTNYVGLTGLLSLFTRKGQKPTPPVNLAADFGGGGLSCALGIVLALLERTKSGKGQVIDANMVQGTSYLGSWLYRSQPLPIWGNPPGENVLDTGAHYYETYKTKDGKYMSVGALETQFYQILMDKLGLDLSQYGDYEEKKLILEKKFLSKTQAEWSEIFDGVDACVTPILSIDEAVQHKHNKGVFGKDENGGVYVNPAPVLSRTPGVSKGSQVAPNDGEHTLEILRSLKYSRTEIERFQKLGILGETNLSLAKL